jgi:hypothetical protein
VRQALGKRKTATYKPLPHSRLKMWKPRPHHTAKGQHYDETSL